MTYHHAHDSAHTVRLHGLGDLSAGDKVTLRFRPGAGVNQRNFTSPTYLGWGTGGTLVYKGSVRSANYTLRQIANMMPAITLRVATRAGLPVTFLSALDSDGDERVAEQPDAAPPGGSTPGGAPPGGSTPGGGDQPEPPVPVVPDADAQLRARVEEKTGLSPLAWLAILGTAGALVLWYGTKQIED
jgi:hypothetical protein